jgi:hypothetical protein
MSSMEGRMGRSACGVTWMIPTIVTLMPLRPSMRADLQIRPRRNDNEIDDAHNDAIDGIVATNGGGYVDPPRRNAAVDSNAGNAGDVLRRRRTRRRDAHSHRRPHRKLGNRRPTTSE